LAADWCRQAGINTCAGGQKYAAASSSAPADWQQQEVKKCSGEVKNTQRRAAARPHIGSSRQPKSREQKVKKTQRGGKKISGEQQRGCKLAAAGSQNHVSKRSKKRSGEVKKTQRRAAARPHIGSSRQPKSREQGGQKISGGQQRGRRLAAAGSQNHVSKRSKIRSGGQQRGCKLAAAGGQNHGSRGTKKSAAGPKNQRRAAARP